MPNNLWALLRLWMLKPTVPIRPAGLTAVILILSTVLLAAWAAIDRAAAQPNPQFIIDGFPLLAWYVLAVVGLAAVLRGRCEPKPPFKHVLLLAVGAALVPLAVVALVAADVEPAWVRAAEFIGAAYLFVYFARALARFTGRSQRAAAFAGLVYLVAVAWLSERLNVIPELWAPQETQASESRDASPETESHLFVQADRIDQALEKLGPAQSTSPKAYFLGFAGVGDEKVFAQEIDLAARVLGERFAVGPRTLSLINDQRDLDSAPLATVSGLRYALRELGDLMNVDQDVLILAISSHGSKDPAIAVSNSQLPLDDLSAEDLAAALRESGIKWRVVIISACYAGGFIDSLQDPRTIIITAAAADRTSFGCSNDRDLTYFGEAFYRDSLPTARSLRDAFDVATAAILARERKEHMTPSNPQAYFGKEIESKLASMTPPKRTP